MRALYKPKTLGSAVDTRRLTLLAFLVAVSLIISFIENLFPPLIPLAPGAKLGLGNIAPLIALILLGVGDAYTVMILKCLLGATVSGGVSGLMYSIPSGLVALTVEVLLFLTVFDRISVAMISLIGAMAFNAVQLLVASLITGVNLITLLPWLLLAGFLAGCFTGLLTYYIIKRLPNSVYGRRNKRQR